MGGAGVSTLPRPAPVDLANNTDLYIRALAYAVDAAIGTAFKVSTLLATATIDGNSQAMLNFPNLGVVTGALVEPAGITNVAGARTTYPPVPPASIGWTMMQTPAQIQVQAFGSPGQVLIRAFTMSTNRGQNNGVTQQWGTQLVVPAGTNIPVVGIAWGPV